MSYKATAWAYDLPLKGPAKPVLTALADFADEAGSCYPGQEKLCLMTGYSLRAVQRALARLEGMGLIRREHRYDRRGYRTSDRYVLSLDVQVLGVTEPSGQRALEADSRSLGVTLTQPRRHSDGVTTSRTTSDPPGGPQAPDPTPEPVGNPTTATPEIVPWCKRHASTEGTDRPCASCARAKTLWSAQAVADSRTNVWQTSSRKSKLDPAVYCEHAQFLGKCDICAYEERKAAEIITQQFGERA